MVRLFFLILLLFIPAGEQGLPLLYRQRLPLRLYWLCTQLKREPLTYKGDFPLRPVQLDSPLATLVPIGIGELPPMNLMD